MAMPAKTTVSGAKERILQSINTAKVERIANAKAKAPVA